MKWSDESVSLLIAEWNRESARVRDREDREREREVKTNKEIS